MPTDEPELSAEEIEAPFFSFSNAGGFDAHKTLEAAKAQAESELDNERDNAGDEGWEEDDTSSICYGLILGGVEETARMSWNDHLRQQGTAEEDLPTNPRFDQFVDYALKEYGTLPRLLSALAARERERDALTGAYQHEFREREQLRAELAARERRIETLTKALIDIHNSGASEYCAGIVRDVFATEEARAALAAEAPK
jgi:hypothetical protein